MAIIKILGTFIRNGKKYIITETPSNKVNRFQLIQGKHVIGGRVVKQTKKIHNLDSYFKAKGRRK